MKLKSITKINNVSIFINILNLEIWFKKSYIIMELIDYKWNKILLK